MTRSLSFTRVLACTSVCLALPALALPPVTTTDTFGATEDVPLVVAAAAGVLSNDSLNGNTAMNAVLVAGPAHGTLTLNEDGSFTYTPAANYNGADSFSYKARKVVPPVVFTIDSAQSKVRVTATVTTTAGADTDTADSRLSGTMTAAINPSGSPFSDIHVTDLNTHLIDAATLDFGFGCVFGFCLASLKVQTRATDPDWMTGTMVTPGPVAAVGAGGVFTQTGNSIRMRGVVDITAGGAAAGQVPNGPQTLDSTATQDFTNAVITSNGTTLTLKLPFNFSGRFFLDPANTASNYADITVKTAFTGSGGFIVGTAPVSANVAEESEVTTVTLNVGAVNDAPVAVVDGYLMRQASTLTVPAAATAGTQDLVAAGAVWKYLYNGQNIGTTWREWAYDDAAWLSGPAELGFGDTADGRPEATNIRPGTTPNHRTAYFRRKFNVAGLANTTGLKVSLVRDDGAVVYLNGNEVVRDNLPAKPAVIDSTTTALASVSGADEAKFFDFTVDPAWLVEGENVIAVEVHQQSDTSSDVSFDLRLVRTTGAAGVLANDTDVDTAAAALTATVLSQPAHGTLSMTATGGFTYTPAAGYSGADSFTYEVGDGSATPVSLPLLPTGSVWKYLADGTDLGTEWRATDFDDSTWNGGAAELGYGDTADGRPEATRIRPDGGTTVYPTYYFRARFTLTSDRGLLKALTGRLLRDDAAAIYLNGVEVYRDANLSPTAGFSDFTINNQSTPSEVDYAALTLPLSALIDGENVVAVEVHQASATSSDVSFDLELTATAASGARVALTVNSDDEDSDGVSDFWERQNGFNYTLAADASRDTDGDGQSNKAEFLAGTNPRNIRDYLHASSVSEAGGTVSLTFKPVSPALRYQLEAGNDLSGWAPVGAGFSPAGTTTTRTVPVGAGDRFFRLRLLTTWP